MSAPLKTILPRRGGVKPTIELTSVVLPTPLRPSRPRICPCSSCKRQPLQHIGVAVIGVDVLDVEDRHRSTTSTGAQIDFLNLGAGADALGRPAFQAFRRNAEPIFRSATSNTMSMSCSINRIAMLAIELLQEPRHLGGLAGRQTGRRLVEQQNVRVAGETEHDFKLALLAVGQIPHLGVLAVEKRRALQAGRAPCRRRRDRTKETAT